MSDSRSWLNGLSAEVVSKFYDWNVKRNNQQVMLNSEVPADLAHYVPLDSSLASGAHWIEHITCETINPPGSLVDFSGQYPRFQIQFKKREAATNVVKTPQKKGQQQGASDAKVFFVEERCVNKWDELKSVATDSGGGKFALSFHHIAYRAGHPTGQLPDTLGSGMAIAHLCDNHRCVKKSHMFLLTQQRNMDMQRCTGAVLLVKDGVILQAIECPHFSMQGNIVEQPSCAKVRIVDVGDNLVVAPHRQAEFEKARKDFEINTAIEYV